MDKKTLTRLIEGYKDFHRDYSGVEYDAYRKAASLGQSPKVMVISCSDSRVSPSIVMRAELGDIFLVCNVANIVPPYRPGKGTHHSTSSALEFAVGTLGVEDIVVMGHSGCGGIRALLDGAPIALDGEYSFIRQWVEIIKEAGRKTAHLPESKRYAACEQEALKISLENLSTFPWVAEKMAAGTLATHAWHFDIPTGAIHAYDTEQNEFVPLDE
jgi:carbonic anhydrase